MKKNYFFSSVVALAVVIGFSACDQDLPEMVEANDVEVAATSGELRSAMLWDDGFGFHCNNAKGNGRTDVTINGITFRANNQNDNGGNPAMHATLFRVGETTVWRLEPINGVIVCATCGRTDWVTYSNKNGVINGKNIQAHHPRPGEVPPPVEPEPIEFVVEFLNYKVIPASGALNDFELGNDNDLKIIDTFIANDENGFATAKPPYENPNDAKYEFVGWKAFEDGQLLPSSTTAEMLREVEKDMVVFAVFTLYPVVVSYNRYLAYVELWNDIDQREGRDYVVRMGAFDCALAHYNALLEHYKVGKLPPFWHFCSNKQDVYDLWADKLEGGLERMAEDLGIDLNDWVKNHISNTEIGGKCNPNCNC